MQSLDRVLNILDVLEGAPRSGYTLAEITDAVALPKPTVHRMLAVLERRGHVRRTATGKHTLGPRLISLGQVASANSSLGSVSGPILDRLVAACGETVHLGVLQGDALLYVDRREPDDVAVRLAALPSPLSSLHASASGKVLLAFADPEFVDRVLAGPLPGYTPGTVVDPEGLRRQLAIVRERGYATNEQERLVGVRAVAVPVRRRNGEVVAALSVAGPIQRVDDVELERLRGMLEQAAQEFAGTLA